MKLIRVAATAALALFVVAAAQARADSSDIGEPVALGLDVGTSAIDAPSWARRPSACLSTCPSGTHCR